ncbi:hypothetical protein [Hymenobacter nivis]|uniref:Uncharacterized protein n=1 Tax=Hymenobacter nivis TaxID=1850093 RepID=A0A502HD74_9BACT|nr:hypothetical protein [Hymenobacter nivis]TPG71984.1 hypothetical protein EAH73_01700 [Hymenobacter nivis]
MNTNTWILTLLGSVVVGVMAWLFQRAIAGIDKKADDNYALTSKTMAVVQEMRVEMTGYNMLVEYLSGDVKELKSENRVLRDAHHTFDKYIAVQQALKTTHSPN